MRSKLEKILSQQTQNPAEIRAQFRQFLANGTPQIEPLAEPVRQHGGKRPPAGRCHGQIRLQHAGKFENPLVLENDRIQLLTGDAHLTQAGVYGMAREVRIVYFRVKRSSWTAAAIRPLQSNTAAASW